MPVAKQRSRLLCHRVLRPLRTRDGGWRCQDVVEPATGRRRSRCTINKEGEPTRSCEPSIEDGTISINNSFFPELRRSNGHPTTNSKDPLPSPYYRKGKRWKDIHPTKSL